MRKLLILVFILSLLTLSSCEIEKEPEEVNWLTLKGTLMTMEPEDIEVMVSSLSIAEFGLRHLDISIETDFVLSANVTYGLFQSEPIEVIEAPINLDLDFDYYVDQREENTFFLYAKTAGVLSNSNGSLFGMSRHAHLDFIFSYFSNLENTYYAYNNLAYLDNLILGMADKQMMDNNEEITSWNPSMDPLSTLMLELQQFVFTHVGLFVDHMDVYDVRYGHRLELNFTLEELFSLYEPINAYVNLDETDLNQMLTIQMFIKNNHLILLEFEIEGLTILLESSFDELSWFGITVHDGFIMDCTLDFSLFYHLHDVNPVLPTPSTLSAYRMVEAFSTPSLDDFTLFGS